jgi:hypothetical protein
MIAVFAISESSPSGKRSVKLSANNNRSGDQQPKKQRHQQGRNKPLTKIESVGIGHVTAFYG